MSFFKNVATVLLSSAVSIPLGLLVSVVLTRNLPVDDRGAYSLMTAFGGLVTTVMNLGWMSGSIYRLRRGAPPARVSGAALTAVAVLAGSAVAVCLVFQQPIRSQFMAGAPDWVYYAALVFIPSQMLGSFFASIARGIDRFDLRNWYQVLVPLANLVLFTVLLMGLGLGLAWAVGALLATQGIAALTLSAIVLRQTGIDLRVSRSEYRASLSYSLKSYMDSVAGQLHERIDLFMISFFLRDPAQVAFYAIAAGMLQQLKAAPEAIGMALFPQLAGYDAERAAQFTARVTRHSTLWTVTLSVVLALLAPWVVRLLYGSEYDPSIRPFLIVLPGMAFLTTYRMLARYFIAMAWQRVTITTQLVCLAVNVGLNVVLIPRHGIEGAALSSLVSYSLMAVLLMITFRTRSGIPLSETLVVRRDDLAEYGSRLAQLRRRLRRGTGA